jgi:hypothetical protein
MSRTPQAESIYTLQRRIGAHRHLGPAEPRTGDADVTPTKRDHAARRRSMVGKLFAWRVRSA